MALTGTTEDGRTEPVNVYDSLSPGFFILGPPQLQTILDHYERIDGTGRVLPLSWTTCTPSPAQPSRLGRGSNTRQGRPDAPGRELPADLMDPHPAALALRCILGHARRPGDQGQDAAQRRPAPDRPPTCSPGPPSRPGTTVGSGGKFG
ncbi:hypothetical protein [Streptomyces sp. AS13]|uniref:hypothetical protein n=1 Tax=Streptomyces sp. AS13 TaxID=3038080 RepID=UPI00278BBB34|nr:hypothetical protein [Streptomyces sp. AS13]